MMSGSMGRKARRAAAAQGPAPQEKKVQLPELAFTVTGHAYEHGIKDRKEYTRIIAFAPPSSINYAIQLSKARASGSPPSRPSIDATPREKGAAMEGTEEYLWVGLVMENLDASVLKKAHPSGNQPMGTASCPSAPSSSSSIS
jgi:hypothetical protein